MFSIFFPYKNNQKQKNPQHPQSDTDTYYRGSCIYLYIIYIYIYYMWCFFPSFHAVFLQKKPPKKPDLEASIVRSQMESTLAWSEWTSERSYRRSPFLMEEYVYIYIWMFPKIGVPQNGWFIMENPIKMDDLGVVPRWFVSRMGHQKWFFDMYKTLVVTKVENTRTHLARKNDELILGNWN